MKYKLYFIKADSVENDKEVTFIGEYNCTDSYMQAIDDFLKKINFKSYYKRLITKSTTEKMIDYGSHWNFFKVVIEND